MKSFNEGIQRYFRAIMIELRGGITKSPLHLLKTVVILFIPFFYAFTYLWAFYDPIGKTENIEIALVTSKDDAMGDFVKAKAEGKGIEIHNGPNVKMTANLKHIYSDELDGPVEADSQIVKDSLLTINVPNLDHEIVATLRNAIVSWEAAKTSAGSYVDSLAKTMGTFLAANTINGKPSTNYNYKKNFLIGFATDIASAQSGGLNEVLNMVFEAIQLNGGDNLIKNMITGNVNADGTVTGQWIDPDNAVGTVPAGTTDAPVAKTILTTVAHHQWAANGADPLLPTITEAEYDRFINALQPHIESIRKLIGHQGGHTINAGEHAEYNNAVAIIAQHSQLGSHGKEVFGIGLSPFFISIGVWFGAVAMSLLVHRKIYNKKTFIRWRYLAKGTIINFGIIIQVTILMFSLKMIGLGSIGFAQWSLMYGSALFIAIIFGTFIMAVRLSISSRSLSVYLIVIFMVLNIVCSGGLFPIQTQNAFVRAMNTWLPMHFSVEILRQGLVDTNWAIWGENMGYLSIYLLFVPIGVVLNYFYTHRWYIRYDYKMPAHMQKHHDKWVERHPKRSAEIIKRLRAAGKKEEKGGDS